MEINLKQALAVERSYVVSKFLDWDLDWIWEYFNGSDFDVM